MAVQLGPTSPKLHSTIRHMRLNESRALSAALLLSIATSACSLAPRSAAPASGVAPVSLSCMAPAQPQLKTILYFGLARPAGTVTEAEWQTFVRDVVTPAFPDGLTGWDVEGQWRRADGQIIRERSKVILIVHPDTPPVRRSIESLISRYKQAFQQESVLWETTPVCAMF